MVLFRLIKYNGDVMTRILDFDNSLVSHDFDGHFFYTQFFVNSVATTKGFGVRYNGPHKSFFDSIRAVHILDANKDSFFEMRCLKGLEQVTFEPGLHMYGVAFGGKVERVELPENLKVVHCHPQTKITNFESIMEADPNMDIVME